MSGVGALCTLLRTASLSSSALIFERPAIERSAAALRSASRFIPLKLMILFSLCRLKRVS